MNNQQLTDYIKEQFSQGVNKETISRNLISQGGWSQSDIDNSLRVIESNVSVSKKLNSWDRFLVILFPIILFFFYFILGNALAVLNFVTVHPVLSFMSKGFELAPSIFGLVFYPFAQFLKLDEGFWIVASIPFITLSWVVFFYVLTKISVMIPFTRKRMIYRHMFSILYILIVILPLLFFQLFGRTNILQYSDNELKDQYKSANITKQLSSGIIKI